MPLILARADYVRWLGEEPDPREPMRPFPAEPMQAGGENLSESLPRWSERAFVYRLDHSASIMFEESRPGTPSFRKCRIDAGGASGGRFSFFEFALMLVIPGALLILLAALLLTGRT